MKLVLVCVVLVLSALICAVAEDKPKHEPLSDELIDYVNSRKDGTWKASKSKRFKNVHEFRSALGTRREDPKLKEFRRPTVSHDDVDLKLPRSFDAREHWPECESIRHIRDQSSCGSCWAFGAVTAMSDRVCIHSNQTITRLELSAKDLLGCCKDCGYGCVGGWPGPAWDYWRDHGIVSGGDFGDKGSCLPYPFAPCSHHGSKSELYPPCPIEMYPTPTCSSACQIGYPFRYEDDKIRASSSYNVYRDAKVIQKEIWLRGPVEASMNVYADFGNYHEGVYQHTSGEILGGHAIRLLGWGETAEGIPYWLAANSWNPTWGEKGYFRILRGSDHCGIESDVVAGIPIIP